MTRYPHIPLIVLIMLSGIVPVQGQSKKQVQKPLAQAKSTQATASEAQKRFDKAVQLAQQGKYDAAIAEMQAVKKMAPNEPAVYINLGQFHLHKQDYGNAEHAFRGALAVGSKEPFVYAQLVRILMAKDKDAEALDMAKKAAKGSPKDYDTRYLLGVLYLKGNRYADAETEFKAALAIKPGENGALYNLGFCQVNLKKYIDARKTLAGFLKNNPDDAQARVLAGVAHEQTGDNIGAAGHYERAAWTGAPSSKSAILNLVRVYDKLDKPDKTLDTLKKAAGLMKDDYDINLALGQALFAQGKYEDAEPALLAAKKAKSDTFVNLNLALNYLNLNKNSDAENSAQAAIKQDPKGKQSLEVYGYVLDMSGKKDEAVAQYRKWEEYYPKETTPNVKIANIYQAQNKNDLAVKEYQKAMSKEPGNTELMISASTAMRTAGKPDDAIALLDKVVAAQPQNETAYMAMAGIYEQQDKIDLAIEQYNRILAFNPKSTGTMQRLAAAYDTKKDYESEIGVYKKMVEQNPADTRSAMMIPRLYEKADKLDAAIAESKKLVDTHPDDTNMRIQYADLLGKKGNWPGAIEQYDKLIANDQVAISSQGCYLKGVALEKLGKTDDAIASYKKCLEGAPAAANALDALGKIYDSAAKKDEYYSYLASLIEPGADDAPYAYFADVYKNAGKAEEAIKTLEQLHDKHPENTSLASALAGCYKDAGDNNKAIIVYNKLLEKNSNDASTLRSLGDIYAAMDRNEEAAEKYSSALKAWPFDPALQVKLGDIYVKLGKKDEALAAYKQAQGMNPGDNSISDKVKSLENPQPADNAGGISDK